MWALNNSWNVLWKHTANQLTVNPPINYSSRQLPFPLELANWKAFCEVLPVKAAWVLLPSCALATYQSQNDWESVARPVSCVLTSIWLCRLAFLFFLVSPFPIASYAGLPDCSQKGTINHFVWPPGYHSPLPGYLVFVGLQREVLSMALFLGSQHFHMTNGSNTFYWTIERRYWPASMVWGNYSSWQDFLLSVKRSDVKVGLLQWVLPGTIHPHAWVGMMASSVLVEQVYV